MGGRLIFKYEWNTQKRETGRFFVFSIGGEKTKIKISDRFFVFWFLLIKPIYHSIFRFHRWAGPLIGTCASLPCTLQNKSSSAQQLEHLRDSEKLWGSTISQFIQTALFCKFAPTSSMGKWRAVFLLFASFLSSRQDDRYHSFDCACNNKEKTGRARPLLISLAQILVVNGKC